jgi:hypothetical protein
LLVIYVTGLRSCAHTPHPGDIRAIWPLLTFAG